MVIKFALQGKTYIGGRTIIGTTKELNCRSCFKQLEEPQDKYLTYWCSYNRKAYCRDCITNQHNNYPSHEDLAIDILEVTK